MASTVIKGGTVVTHDLTYPADVLIEGGRIADIGPDLRGDETLDATGCLVMPGGIDPHTHLEMPFMGTYSSDDFESGTRAALAGGTTMVVDFVLPGRARPLLDGLQMWHNKSGRANCDYSFHMSVTLWGEKSGTTCPRCSIRASPTFKHFMAYKGALDGERRRALRVLQPAGGLGGIALVQPRTATSWPSCSASLGLRGNTRPEAHAYSRPAQVEGEATNRAIMIPTWRGCRSMSVQLSYEERHEAIRRARAQGKRVWGEPLIQHSNARRQRVPSL
jgi:dihydropyrimidinase